MDEAILHFGKPKKVNSEQHRSNDENERSDDVV